MSTPGTTWQDAPELIAAQKRIRRTLLLAQVLGGIGIGAGVSMGSLMAFGVTGDESLSGISGTVGALSTALLAGPMVTLAMRSGRRLSLTAGWVMAATSIWSKRPSACSVAEVMTAPRSRLHSCWRSTPPANSGEALAGSSTNTSSAAPPTWPESSAAFSAACASGRRACRAASSC